jgi:NAD(P)-dependent dehydrogenase (short-subunit alcohol dehydrogenase family)
MSTQVVLITGGLSGIGRAAAVAFANKGAKVVVAGRRDQAGKALVKELRSFGSEAEFINADVRRDDDVRALVDKTVARFGRLDVAVNNAGTEGQVGPITDQTAESYAATFDTNVLGVILSMKHEVRVMQRQGSGSIINISSTYGHEGAAGASIYVGSKHAVEGITKSVALEIAKSGIRVNKAAVATQVPLGRPLRGGRRRHRLHCIGRSQIHHGSRPQRRRRTQRQLILSRRGSWPASAVSQVSLSNQRERESR